MKKLTLLAVAIVALASCSKDYVDADMLHNQGETEAKIGGVVLTPGEKTIVPHSSEYEVVCGEKCKVSINGIIHTESGLYMNLISKKLRR